MANRNLMLVFIVCVLGLETLIGIISLEDALIVVLASYTALYSFSVLSLFYLLRRCKNGI